MAQFDPSCIAQFTVPGDTTNIYCMIDARIVADVEAGLTQAQKATVEAYRWVPTQVQLQGDYSDPLNPITPVVPSWAGNDPAPVYFRTTAAKMQAALAKYYK